MRRVVHVWFSLIGFSAVLTYQHQVVDVIAGFLLAILCFYFLRESSPRPPATNNVRAGSYYGAGAVAAVALAVASAPIGCVLLWPALSLTLMASAYFGLGPGVFRKEAGRLPLSSRIVLGPCLLGQHLSLVYYKRRSNAQDEVVPGVWIGRRLNRHEAATAVRQGITRYSI
jgi:hypothetical protein